MLTTNAFKRKVQTNLLNKLLVFRHFLTLSSVTAMVLLQTQLKTHFAIPFNASSAKTILKRVLKEFAIAMTILVRAHTTEIAVVQNTNLRSHFCRSGF